MADKKRQLEVSKTTKRQRLHLQAKQQPNQGCDQEDRNQENNGQEDYRLAGVTTTTKAYDDAVKAVIKDYKKKKQITEDGFNL